MSFYRNKARFVKAACEKIVKDFGGQVPTTLDEMVTLPGVGRKTANLVMILAHKSQQNICVDTHVHRIANRLGWVKTRLPEETEQALYAATDSRWWPLINLYLVTWGQNVCRPVFPRCGDCAIAGLCPRIGVSRIGKSRQAKALTQRRGSAREVDIPMTTYARSLTIAALLVAGSVLVLAQAKPPAKPAAPQPAAPRRRNRRQGGDRAGTADARRRPRRRRRDVKGTFEFETYPNEAPRTVEHVLNLVKKNFYNGLRFHRVEPGFVIQVGDPNTRDLHEEGPLGHRRQRHAGGRRRALAEAPARQRRGGDGASRQSPRRPTRSST